MKFIETEVAGVLLIDLEPSRDERGTFARSFDATIFAERGLQSHFVQHSISVSAKAGTLRGLHYQAAPADEVKIVRCTAGAIHDVVVDLRRDSPTFKRSVAIELTRQNGRAVYVPRGCAHGFLTLEDDAEVHYMISAPYEAALSRGVRWNDSAFAIQWPRSPVVISPRDASFPDFPVHSKP